MEILNGILIDRTVENTKCGRLSIIGAAFRTRRAGSRTDWQVVAECDCGQVGCYYLRNLNTGMTTSCGCVHKERTSKAAKKHGYGSKPLYAVWGSMLARCKNPNNMAYERYGGRGIKVCDRWLEFSNFLADMGERPTEQHSIDRIDNNGDYCPENCRWATREEQGKNKRNNLVLTINGETKHYSEWAEQYGLARSTVLRRIKKGCVGEDCIKPSRNRFKNLKKPYMGKEHE